MRSVLGVHWKDWCWSWNSSTLATWSEELTHMKRPRCRERLNLWGEGDNRGWDGWMPSSTRWTWVSVDSGGWWWTGRPGVLRFMPSQRVGHDWATELNWTDALYIFFTWYLCPHTFWVYRVVMFVSISHLDLFFSLDTDPILTILMLKEHSIWFIDFTFFFLTCYHYWTFGWFPAFHHYI